MRANRTSWTGTSLLFCLSKRHDLVLIFFYFIQKKKRIHYKNLPCYLFIFIFIMLFCFGRETILTWEVFHYIHFIFTKYIEYVVEPISTYHYVGKRLSYLTFLIDLHVFINLWIIFYPLATTHACFTVAINKEWGNQV